MDTSILPMKVPQVGQKVLNFRNQLNKDNKSSFESANCISYLFSLVIRYILVRIVKYHCMDKN